MSKETELFMAFYAGFLVKEGTSIPKTKADQEKLIKELEPYFEVWYTAFTTERD